MKLEIRKFVADDASVSYVDVGNGRPLVYINGFGEDISTAHNLIEKWSRFFRVVVFDHRGFGESDDDYEVGIDRSARDLRILMDLLGLTNVALVAYSMGGAVAFSYIEQFGRERLERLVLADTTPKMINENGWHLGLWQGRYTRDDYERDLKTIVDNPMLFHLSFYARAATKSFFNCVPNNFPAYDDVVQWLECVAEITKIRVSMVKRIFSFNLSEKKKKVERRYWETMTGGDWRHVLKSIEIPTLCLYADPGSFYYSGTAEYMANQVPHASALAIQNASHVCPKENFDDFTSKIRDFCTC